MRHCIDAPVGESVEGIDRQHTQDPIQRDPAVARHNGKYQIGSQQTENRAGSSRRDPVLPAASLHGITEQVSCKAADEIQDQKQGNAEETLQGRSQIVERVHIADQMDKAEMQEHG